MEAKTIEAVTVVGVKKGRRAGKRSLIRDTRGANLVEYIMLVGLVAVLCLAGFRVFGRKVLDRVKGQTNELEQINVTSEQ